MSNKGLVSLADNQQKKEEERKALERKAKSERNAKLIPMIALVACNLIFLSLEIRAVQAVYLISGSALLAAVTMLVSGGLAMLWFDVLYPHSKKHKNELQLPYAYIGIGLAILLASLLAFADYFVTTNGQVDPLWANILWAIVVILTVVQGFLLARWWMLDKHIEAEAKQESAIAEATDAQGEIAILRAKLNAMSDILADSVALQSTYGRDAVAKVAKFLDIPLPDIDQDGIPDAIDPIDNRTGKPFVRPQEAPRAIPRQMSTSYAASTPQVAETDESNPTPAGKRQ